MAHLYPLGMLTDEASIVTTRLNRQLAGQAIALQSAMSSIMSKEGGKHFGTIIENLMR